MIERFGATTAVIAYATEIRRIAQKVIRFVDGRVALVEVDDRRAAPAEIAW